MGFAEPGRSPDLLVGSYPTVSPLPRRGTGPRRGGLLSVALSLAFRPVGVTHHRVLRCPDFPPVAGNRSKTRSLRPTPTTSGRLFHPTPLSFYPRRSSNESTRTSARCVQHAVGPPYVALAARRAKNHEKPTCAPGLPQRLVRRALPCGSRRPCGPPPCAAWSGLSSHRPPDACELRRP